MEHSFVIQPASQEDIPAVAQMAFELFLDTDHTRLVAPRAMEHLDEFYQWTLHRYRARFNNPNLIFKVAKNSAGEVVACSIWTPEGESSADRHLPGPSFATRFETMLLSLESSYHRYVSMHCIDWDAIEAWKQAAEVVFSTIPNRLQLDILLVRADHQRRGLGKLMINWGKEVARNASIPLALESTERGLPVYEKEGFTFIGNVEPKGSTIKIPAMVWWPDR